MFKAPSGINFSSGELPAPELAGALCRVASFVQQIEPYNAILHLYTDWWQHDGLHFYKGTITLHKLFESVQSPQSLLSVMPGDDRVCVGVAPESNDWYLRFYLSWDDSGFELLGYFDITIPSAKTIEFRQHMAWLDLPLQEQDADTFYSHIRL